jgi:hypothetical protein
MNRFGVRRALLASGIAALVCALIVGVSDNPPGIALLYGAMICLVLATVAHWRRPRSYFWLFILSAIGFVVFAVLHNVLYGLGELTSLSWLKAVLGFLHAVAFLIALLLCPAGVVIGLLGGIVRVIVSRRAPELSTGNDPTV